MHRPNTTRGTYQASVKRVMRKVVAFVFVGAIITLALTDTAVAGWFGFASEEAPQAELEVVRGTELNSQTLTLLRAARNINPNLAHGGGDIQITQDGDALVAEQTPYNTQTVDEQQPFETDQISWRVIDDRGDTLSQIAEQEGVSVNTIVWANELSSDTDIHPGDVLLILPISGLQHEVKKGDTLKSIAKEYSGGADEIDSFMEEILEYNRLADASMLTVGQTLTIPGGMIEEEAQSTAVYTKVVSGGPTYSGYYAHPVPGMIKKTQGLHGYNAVDFGADYGTRVRAAAAGTIVVSRGDGRWNGGYGNYVVIDHPNGTQTLYAHNSSNTVWQGQSVVQGQVIGYIGSTGRSTGNHLHFEVRGATNPF